MRLVTMLLLVTAAAGCGTGGRPAARPSAATTAPASSPTPAPSLNASCERRSGGDRGAAMLLTDVRVAAQEGFDRVVFEFEPRSGQPATIPYWETGFTTPPLRQDASGEEITVRGEAFLHTVIWASGVDLSGGEAREVYKGPKKLEPADTKVIREVRHAGDFENVLTWYVGLSRRACFQVREFRDPVRLVIDVES